tara:strand:- start:12222 stop:13220 length:999 start_codon:yes stop_codon:yes gene_type:complete
MKSIYKGKSILITGGTGSFGSAFIKFLLTEYKDIKKIVIFSRDELKQYYQKIELKKFDDKLRFFIGDVRDKNRLLEAFRGIDYVIHAAALKQVESSEYNPIETIKTNVLGAQNIIEAAIYNKVKKVVVLSTDKAVAPINLYGASKLCSDKLFVSANSIVGNMNISFSVVRYGNVMGSRGSVVPVFLKQKTKGEILITDKEMTRFNIMMHESISMVDYVIKNSYGGEIVVPKIPSFNIMDLAKSIAPNIKIKITGIRPGEKIHEDLITSNESLNTYDIGKYYVILTNNSKLINFYLKKAKAKKVKKFFSYNSNTNSNFLSVLDLKKLILKFKN